MMGAPQGVLDLPPNQVYKMNNRQQ